MIKLRALRCGGYPGLYGWSLNNHRVGGWGGAYKSKGGGESEKEL